MNFKIDTRFVVHIAVKVLMLVLWVVIHERWRQYISHKRSYLPNKSTLRYNPEDQTRH